MSSKVESQILKRLKTFWRKRRLSPFNRFRDSILKWTKSYQIEAKRCSARCTFQRPNYKKWFAIIAHFSPSTSTQSIFYAEAEPCAWMDQPGRSLHSQNGLHTQGSSKATIHKSIQVVCCGEHLTRILDLRRSPNRAFFHRPVYSTWSIRDKQSRMLATNYGAQHCNCVY